MNNATKQRRSQFLDIARLLAALAVCAGHLRSVLFEHYADIIEPTFSQKIFYGVTSLGHESVVIFFVLSGYFVGGSILLNPLNINWLTYLHSRLIRLWVVLIPAHLLTACVDGGLSFFYPDVISGNYNERWMSGPRGDGIVHGALVLVGNALFQQTVFVPIFGTNSPLWSLANEFYYYIMFPLLAATAGVLPCVTSQMHRGIYGVCVCITFLLLPSGFIVGFTFFCAGAGISFLTQSGLLSRSRHILNLPLEILLFALLVWMAKSSYFRNEHCNDFLTAAEFSLFLMCSFPYFGSFPGRHSARFVFPDMSYSIYLSHFPCVLVIGAMFATKTPLSAHPLEIGLYISLLSTILVYSYIFWRMFERNTPWVRSHFSQYFSK